MQADQIKKKCSKYSKLALSSQTEKCRCLVLLCGAGVGTSQEVTQHPFVRLVRKSCSCLHSVGTAGRCKGLGDSFQSIVTLQDIV